MSLFQGCLRIIESRAEARLSKPTFEDPMEIDRSNAMIGQSWQFEPFQVPEKGILLREMDLPKEFELIIFERNGERRALSTREMAYHHIAQGVLGGAPFLVSF